MPSKKKKKPSEAHQQLFSNLNGFTHKKWKIHYFLPVEHWKKSAKIINTEWTVEKLEESIVQYTGQEERVNKEFDEIVSGSSSDLTADYTVISESAKIYAADGETLLVAVFAHREIEYEGAQRIVFDGIKVGEGNIAYTAYQKLCSVDPPMFPDKIHADSSEGAIRYAKFESEPEYQAFLESTPDYSELTKSDVPPIGATWEEANVGTRYDTEPYCKRSHGVNLESIHHFGIPHPPRQSAESEIYMASCTKIRQVLNMMLFYADEPSHKEMCKYFNRGRKNYDSVPPYFGMTTLQNVQRVPPRVFPDHHMFSALTPIGEYEGGYVVLPQLKMKIKYNTGYVIFLRPSLIYHGITDYSPKAMGPNDVLCPGRLSLMFYLHKDAYLAYKEYMQMMAEIAIANREKRNLKRKASEMEEEDGDEEELLVYEYEDGEIDHFNGL